MASEAVRLIPVKTPEPSRCASISPGDCGRNTDQPARPCPPGSSSHLLSTRPSLRKSSAAEELRSGPKRKPKAAANTGCPMDFRSSAFVPACPGLAAPAAIAAR